MDDFYREEILDHYFSSSQRGRLDRPSLAADGTNPLCGDIIHLEIAVDADGTISAARFEGEGCAISQAAVSMLTEHLEGRSTAEARAFSAEDMLHMLKIPLTPARLKCGLLGWKTLQKALGGANAKPTVPGTPASPPPQN
jgi:nitrogen fixation NifU-like protein